MPLFQTAVGPILFIHVPKTGGSSIEAHLSAHCTTSLMNSRDDPSVPCKSQHYHREILERLLRGVPIRHSFMIVRHPVDRVRSEFVYQTRYFWKFYRGLSFSAWLRYNIRRAQSSPCHRDNHFRPQRDFEAFQPEIFRFEEGLEGCFRWLESTAGVPHPRTAIHHKRSRSGQPRMSRSDLDLVGAFYHKDFERYGYRR